MPVSFRRAVLAGLCLPTVLALAGCSSSAAPAPTATTAPTSAATSPAPAFHAVLVTDTGGVHDRSFNELAWKGLNRAHQRLGIGVSVVQPSTANAYLPALRRAARAGTDLTFAVGYSMSTAVDQAAAADPNAHFAMIDARPINSSGQQTNLPNVENLLFKEQESGYMVGVIAGLMEKERVGKATHNTIGYLGGEDITPVEHYLGGFVAGIHSVDPTATILGDFAGTFTDAPTGSRFAASQISRGADILFQVAAVTGTGYLDTAETMGVYGIGVDADQSYLGPFIITSAVKHVNSAVRWAVRQDRAGHFQSGDVVLGAKQHATGFAKPSSIVPASIVKAAKQAEKAIAAGKITPPTSIPRS